MSPEPIRAVSQNNGFYKVGRQDTDFCENCRLAKTKDLPVQCPGMENLIKGDFYYFVKRAITFFILFLVCLLLYLANDASPRFILNILSGFTNGFCTSCVLLAVYAHQRSKSLYICDCSCSVEQTSGDLEKDQMILHYGKKKKVLCVPKGFSTDRKDYYLYAYFGDLYLIAGFEIAMED